MNDTLPEKLVVCIGAAIRKDDGKIGWGFRYCNDEMTNLIDDSAGFVVSVRHIKSASVGMVYTMPVSETSVIPQRAKYVGLLKNPELVTEWKLESDSVLAKQREKAMAKEGKTLAVAKSLELLKPVKTMYKTTDHWGKCVIEALVLQYLRNP